MSLVDIHVFVFIEMPLALLHLCLDVIDVFGMLIAVGKCLEFVGVCARLRVTFVVVFTIVGICIFCTLPIYDN